MNRSPDEKPLQDPGSIGPETVLDSVFSKDGPMPTARFSLRALALVLDFILVTAVASLIIWKLILPQSHPGALGEFIEWSQQTVEWMSSNSGDAPMPEPSKDLARAMLLANELQLLAFWLYFAIGEAFFAGSSLGKRICRIRSVSTVTLGPPPILAGITRGGLKTITLLGVYPFIFPIPLLLTFIALFFNKRRQLGHDLCARTAVVDEKYVNLQPRL